RKLYMDGGLVLDLKSGRITLHYDVTTDTKEKRLFFVISASANCAERV
ncbi:TPA: hypothetical protein ACOSHJ_001673, partial [Salmonella enterica]